MFEELNGKGLLIHHWDTDGICSAKLLLEKLKDKEIDNKTPVLGNYYLTNEEIESYSKYDFVIVVDMALTEDNINKLSKDAKVMVFDHHLGKIYDKIFHHNPIIKGEDPDKYPSASWIVNDYLGNDVNLFSILGIIGDHEQKIKYNQEFMEIIDNFCQENKLSFEDLHKMVYLIDSNYKIGDKKAVEKAPHDLLNITKGEEILQKSSWNQNLTNIDNEMEKILEHHGDEYNGILLKKINTPYNIISTITRKISWDSGKNTIVVNTGFFNDKDQIYMRSKKDAAPIIARGKELGFKCGGKKEVLGAIVPKEKTDSFVKEILDFLK